MSDNLSQWLAKELGALLFPIERAATVPGALESMLDELGALPGTDTSALSPAIAAVLDAKTQIEALAEQPTPSFDGVAAVLDASGRALDWVRTIEHGAGALEQLTGLGRDLVDLLVGGWLTALHPVVHQAGVLLTLVELGTDQEPAPVQLNGDQPARLPYRIDRFHVDRLGALLQDPAAVLREEYGNPLATAADADAMASKLFPRVVGLLRELGVPCRYGINDGDEELLADSAPLLAHALAVYLEHPLNVGSDAEAGAVFNISSADRGDLGFVASPFGTLTATRFVRPFVVTVELGGDVQAVAYGRHGFTQLAATDAAEFAGSISAELPADAPFVVGSPEGTRLELAGVRAALETALSTKRQSLSLGADVQSASLVVAPAEGDGFLAAVLPPDGVRTDFTAGLVWSSEQGLTLRGSGSLDTDVPIGRSVLGLSVPVLHLGLHARDQVVDAEVTAALLVRLGPVAVLVDGVGVRAALTSVDGEGNLGGADLELGFKPPATLGLSIDAGPVTGGGLLTADPDQGQYAGEVQLQFERISVRALGLLTTRLPDGKPGFSLLVLVSAEFTPVQLGLGFRLVEVGGLVGVNRTVALDALRAGLKSGALGAVLSPPDPKASASQLVASLAGLFPPAAGRHLFAPTARIVWGSPSTLITIDLALVLELPAPVRLVALGRLRAVLPDERQAIVRLQVDALGLIDFDRAEAAVDATLVDSRLAQFALTGDLALRLSWGERPSFLLAVGGFHPRFAAPPGFPQLQRVSLPLAGGDNPKLRLEAYLALTSNTVQFGARVDLAARAGSFGVAGFLAFDALLTLEPLAFEVELAATLAVKLGGRTLLSVALELTLSGPRPWRAHGRASFSILFFDVSFRFELTIGDQTPSALPAPLDVAPLLIAALADPRAWSAQLPAGADAVTLRGLEPQAAVLAHPLATLQLRQTVAPLERTLDRFGTSVPSGARRFRITLATIGGVRTTLAPLQDRFAPAQFTALSDDAKLSAASFEEMVSGAALGADGYATGPAANVALVYEQALVSAPGVAAPKSQKLALPADVFATLTATPPRRAGAFAVREGA